MNKRGRNKRKEGGGKRVKGEEENATIMEEERAGCDIRVNTKR